MEYSSNMQDVYKKINECNTSRKYNVLIVFDDMIADMLSNKSFYLIVTELFTRDKKLDISLLLLHNLISLCQKVPD